MQRTVVTAHGSIEVAHVPVPVPAPAAGEALVQMTRAGAPREATGAVEVCQCVDAHLPRPRWGRPLATAAFAELAEGATHELEMLGRRPGSSVHVCIYGVRGEGQMCVHPYRTVPEVVSVRQR